MPDSSHKAFAIILDIIKGKNPGSILEISRGPFKSGLLLRDCFELPTDRYIRGNWRLRIDTVETVYSPEDPVSRYIYDNPFTGEIAEIAAGLPVYDVIMLIDVLQHYTKEEGSLLLKELSEHAFMCLIAAVTVNYKPPEDQVKSRWSAVDLLEFDSVSNRIKVDDEELFIFTVFPPLNRVSPLQRKEIPVLTAQARQNLTIGYVLPHKVLTGGMKMLMEQMRHMRKRGHRIYALYRGNPGESVLPEWSNAEADREILVPKDRSYNDYLNGCDIVYAGFFDQLQELSGCGMPVFYWEQGYPWLFGDIPGTASVISIREFMKNCYSQPCAIASVSRTVSRIMEVKFGRNTVIIPNGIDTDFYAPGFPPDDGTIIIVGNPYLQFKGFETALLALQAVWNSGYRFKVNWVSQVMPEVSGMAFPINFIINPSQRELSLCYMKSDIHLFTSWYEGFGLPPLEAMSCRVPVIATKCGGIESYALHGYNALLAEPGDFRQLGLYIIHLLEDKQTRLVLSNRGRETALQYSFPKVVEKLEDYLYSLLDGTSRGNGNCSLSHLIKEETVKKYAADYSIDTLIETGTYLGEMVDSVKDCFRRIYSIELDGALYEAARTKFSRFSHISVIHGDSGEKLPEILKDVQEPCIFWLDGHYSGGITAMGKKQTPILEELSSIFIHRFRHVILIDDARCFTGENDFPTIDSLREFISGIRNNMEFTVKDDIIRII